MCRFAAAIAAIILVFGAAARAEVTFDAGARQAKPPPQQLAEPTAPPGMGMAEAVKPATPMRPIPVNGTEAAGKSVGW